MRQRGPSQSLGGLGETRRIGSVDASVQYFSSSGALTCYWEAPLKPYETVRSDTLRALPHSGGAIELKHKAPEVTFLGVNDQPDFATLFITMYPRDAVIELRSLKEYLYRWGTSSCRMSDSWTSCTSISWASTNRFGFA
jgi:hypothetical protein